MDLVFIEFKNTQKYNKILSYPYLTAILFLLVLMTMTYTFPSITQKIVNVYNRSIFARLTLLILLLLLVLIPGIDLTLSLILIFGVILIITSSNAINYNCPQETKS